MSFKFILVSFFTVLLVSCSGNSASAQVPGTISQDRASDLYMDYDRIQSCPNCNNQIPCLDLYGFKGQPWRDEVPGGCRCSRKKGVTWYNAYHHWPNPWSFLGDHGRAGNRWGKYTDTTCPRFRDRLDIFANVRLAPPVRKDSGYCGPECEPFGLVGKSRRGVVVSGSNPAIKNGYHAGFTHTTRPHNFAFQPSPQSVYAAPMQAESTHEMQRNRIASERFANEQHTDDSKPSLVMNPHQHRLRPNVAPPEFVPRYPTVRHSQTLQTRPMDATETRSSLEQANSAAQKETYPLAVRSNRATTTTSEPETAHQQMMLAPASNSSAARYPLTNSPANKLRQAERNWDSKKHR